MISSSFIYAVGIEDTFVGHAREGERPLDEYELTQHYQNWQADLERAKSLGVSMIRYGIPWYKVEPVQDQFDWSWVDQVMAWFETNPELTPIIDFMHYGTPLWLDNAFLNTDYSDRVAHYAMQFMQRYGHFIRYYTPLNEPFINTHFCCVRSEWPPYVAATDTKSYYQVVINIAMGMTKTSSKIKEKYPESVSVHVDACVFFKSADPALQTRVHLEQEKYFMYWELLFGLIEPGHILYQDFINNGITSTQLNWFKHNHYIIDISGINYYPQWSTMVVNDEHALPVSTKVWTEDFAQVIDQIWTRYKKPLMITETSYIGTPEEKIKWISASLAVIDQKIKSGVDIRGFTYFPFIDLIDWPYKYSGKSVEEEIIAFGLYSLTMDIDGNLIRNENDAARYYREVVRSNSIKLLGVLS